MRFICILLLLFCCNGYVSASQMLRDDITSESQLTVEKHDQHEAAQPMTIRGSMAFIRVSVVKKIVGTSILPGSVLIVSHAKYMPAPVMTAAGIHVKNYLRHIYPAMHFW